MEPGTIFFSYSRKDAEAFAFKLANDLRNAGAKVWIDQMDIPPGRNWDEEIEKALNGATYILFIASEKSVTSQNVLNEVYYAVDESKTVIPIKIHNSVIPFRIRRFQYIDFTGDYDPAFARLVKYLELQTKGQMPAPATSTSQESTQPIINVPAQTVANQSIKQEPDQSKSIDSARQASSIQQGVTKPAKRSKNSRLLIGASAFIAICIALYIVFSPTDKTNNLSSSLVQNDSSKFHTDTSTLQGVNTAGAVNLDSVKAAVRPPLPGGGKTVSDNTRLDPKTERQVQDDAKTGLANNISDANKVEVEPLFPGGKAAWTEYINANRIYPSQASEEGIEGSVTVRFLVNTDGSVSDVSAVGGPMGGGLRKEAIRLIQSSGYWIPATRDGQKVKSYKRISIGFKLPSARY